MKERYRPTEELRLPLDGDVLYAHEVEFGRDEARALDVALVAFSMLVDEGNRERALKEHEDSLVTQARLRAKLAEATRQREDEEIKESARVVVGRCNCRSGIVLRDTGSTEKLRFKPGDVLYIWREVEKREALQARVDKFVEWIRFHEKEYRQHVPNEMAVHDIVFKLRELGLMEE